MRAVIDTNVLVSYLFWEASPVRHIVDPLLVQAEILRSTQSFAELSDVVMRPKFDAYVPIVKRELFLANFYDNSLHVVITERIDVCRDPKDNMFLELAVCGKAGLLLTGDKDLLALDPFRGVRILNPANQSKGMG